MRLQMKIFKIAKILVEYEFFTLISVFLFAAHNWYCTHSPWYMDRVTTICVSSVFLILPLCFPKRIDFLKYARSVFSLYICVFMMQSQWIYVKKIKGKQRSVDCNHLFSWNNFIMQPDFDTSCNLWLDCRFFQVFAIAVIIWK